MSGQQSHAKECSIPCLPSHLLRYSFFLTFWHCHSALSNSFCASPQKQLHIQDISKPKVCESSLFFEQTSQIPAKPFPLMYDLTRDTSKPFHSLL